MASDREDPCDVEAVRRMFAEFGPDAQEWPSQVREWWTEDVVYREDPLWPGAETFAGRDAVLARFLEYAQLMGEQGIELVEARSGGRAVLAIFDFTASGGASGAPISQRWAWVMWTRGGRAREIHAHLDLDAARDKAGVSSSSP